MVTSLVYEISYQVQGCAFRMKDQVVAENQNMAEHRMKQWYPKAYDMHTNCIGFAKVIDARQHWVLR